MSGAKVPMLRSRLVRRLRDLGMDSLDDYQAYLFDPAHIDDERIHFINAITTNKTDFFREAEHFEYLTRIVLPGFQRGRPPSQYSRYLVWSAGCSTGEEPYTQAMVLSEFARGAGSFDFAILATDVSSRVLEQARMGIYEEPRIEPIPPELRGRYLSRGKGASRHLVRVVPELRKRVSFHRLNFMDDQYPVRNEFDSIFCRNVLIYFEKRTQESVINKLCRNLKPGGYLFVGHSELLAGLDVPVDLVAPAVYRKHL